MMNKCLLSLLVTLSAFVGLSLPASAYEWGTDDFNSPKIISVDDVDTSVNYFTSAMDGTNNAYNWAITYNSQTFFPHYDSNQSLKNCINFDGYQVFNRSNVYQTYHHYRISGLTDYRDKLIFTVTNRVTLFSDGSDWFGFKFASYDGSVYVDMPVTVYLDGVLQSSPYIRWIADGTVHHYEVVVDCKDYDCNRILLYNNVPYNYTNLMAYYQANYAFSGFCLYKISDSRSFTLSATAYRGGKFTTQLSQNFVDGDYRCVMLYADMPSMPVTDSSSSSSSDSSKDPLEDLPGGKDAIFYLVGSGTAETEEDLQSAFVEYKNALQSRLNRVLESGYSTLQDMMRDANAWVRQNSDDIWVGVVSPSQLQTISENAQRFSDYFVGGTSGYSSAPFSSFDDALGVISRYMGDCVWANYATNALLDSDVTTCPVSFVDASLYYQHQIFDTSSNYYLSYSSPVVYDFDVGQFYRAFGARSDFPADSVVSFIYLVYDGDTCVCAFRLDVDITQYVYSTITTIGDSIKVTPLPSLTDDSALAIDTSSGVDDFTRREMSLYLRDLMDVYYQNISKQLTNIYNFERYNNSYSYVTYNYLAHEDTIQDVPAYYDFDGIVLDSGLDAGMRLTGAIFTDLVTDYHMERYLLFLLGVAAISFILYGRK